MHYKSSWLINSSFMMSQWFIPSSQSLSSEFEIGFIPLDSSLLSSMLYIISFIRSRAKEWTACYDKRCPHCRHCSQCTHCKQFGPTICIYVFKYNWIKCYVRLTWLLMRPSCITSFVEKFKWKMHDTAMLRNTTQINGTSSLVHGTFLNDGIRK